MKDYRGIIAAEILKSPPKIGPSIRERRDQLVRVLTASPDASDRVIAGICGSSRELVKAVRAELIEAGTIPKSEGVKGGDGKVYHVGPRPEKPKVMKPTNLKELILYLHSHPRVRITGPTPSSRTPTTRIEEFTFYDQGRMWFNTTAGEPHFIPLNCSMTDRAAASEAGLTIDDEGFTVTKFGTPIRVEYLS
jgi:hypothetical protein